MKGYYYLKSMMKISKEKNREYNQRWYKTKGREYHKKYSRIKRLQGKELKEYEVNKRKSVDYKGGKCLDCGFNDLSRLEVFDFDHIGKKTFTLAGRMRSNWKKIQGELDWCDLVCANCHRTRTKQRRDIRRVNELKELETYE